MNIKNIDDIQEVISSNPIVILQFKSSACTPCLAIEAKLEQYASTTNDVCYICLEVSEHYDIANAYQVLSVPTVLVFVDYKKAIEVNGTFSLVQVIQQVERYRSLMNQK